MKTSEHFGFSQTLIALALLAAFGPAQAQEGSVSEGWVGVGAGYASGDSKDRARFGLFNGLREDNWYPLFDFGYMNRDSASGSWTTFTGRNLGLDSREAAFTTRKLGDWKFTAEYNEWTRRDPRTANTGLVDPGSTTPTVVRLAAPGTGSDVNLDLQRRSISLGGAKWLNGALQFEATFKTEDKDGARSFGKGFACSAAWVAAGSCATSTTQWALLWLPEPVHSSITQAEAKLTYSSGNLLLTGGYYGSLYNNSVNTLTPTVPGVLNNPLGAPQNVDAGLRATMGLPLALQPDNQAHQFYLSGNYRFTPTTVATFKYAYTHATQNDNFLASGLTGAPPGRADLGGEVNTSIAQLGISSRPMPKLSLTGNVRYESRDNRTPVDLYNIEGVNRFTNGSPDSKRLTGKGEASYLFPMDIRGTVGVDYESVDHGAFTPTEAVAGLSGIRQKTEEWGYRAEVRKSMSETLTGSISYIYSKREGNSPWLKPLSLPATGFIEGNPDPACVPPAAPAVNNCIYNRTGIFPFIFEDRKRDKIRLMATWMPTEQLSLQLFLEDGKDTYTGPTQHGLRDTDLRMYSVDVSYVLSDEWKLSAYASRGESTIHAGHSTGYDAALEDTNDAFGLGLTGKPSDRWQVGADLVYEHDKLVYHQDLDQNASATNIAFLAASGGLPDVTYRLVRAKLYGQYVVDSRSSVRLDLIHERTKFDEWTYRFNGVPFVWSDNTSISALENQNVTFIGVTYIYKWK